MKIQLINEQTKVRSTDELQTYYDQGLIPAEKKPYIADNEASFGPYLGIQSEDGPRYLMDSASQIATLGMGFNPHAFFGTAHFIESWLNDSTTSKFAHLRNSYQSFIERKLNWENVNLHFCHGGAEANEVALGMAYENRFYKEAKRVLAFKGSFHGRTLVALSATWNPVKREPFEWDSSKAVYIDYPELETDVLEQETPDDWTLTWEGSSSKSFKAHWESKDNLLNEEIRILLEIREKLLAKEIYAVQIEPMQCEGGDRYASSRFHNALNALCNACNVALIYDEVQTGFHLGREFFFHKQFKLQNSCGEEVFPSYIVCAKKAQTGLVISHEDSIEKEEFHTASVARGYIHAVAMDQHQSSICALEERVRPRLKSLVEKYSKNLSRPRVCGMAFAVELDDKDWVSKFVGVRFDYGLLYYPAGEKTLRFRLNTSFTDDDLDFLFTQLDHICNKMFNGVDKEPNLIVNTKDRQTSKFFDIQKLFMSNYLNLLDGKAISAEKQLSKITDLFLNNVSRSDFSIINSDNFSDFKEDIEKLEKIVYEPERQTDISMFEAAAQNENGVCLGLKISGKLAAIVFSAPLSIYPYEKSVRKDPNFEKSGTNYMLDCTVHPDHRGSGLGHLMKYAMTLVAQVKRIERVQGRNRDRMASAMLNINLSLGAFEQMYLKEDYNDQEEYRDVFYYTSEPRWNAPSINLSRAVKSPIGKRELTEEFVHTNISAMLSKICLSNFVSKPFLDNIQTIFKTMPKDLQHGYTTSGQSECVDKIVKSIWFENKTAQKMFSFEGCFFGAGSFLSRSLSKPGYNYFETNFSEFPNEANWKDVLKKLDSEISKDEYLGIFIEPVRSSDFSKAPIGFLKGLRKLCTEKNIPLVLNETNSQMYRYSHKHYFASGLEGVDPDMSMAYLGGQAGMVFTNDKFFLEKPLMLISTWDGDEISFARYTEALNEIESNKDEYHSLKNSFNGEVESLLKEYDCVSSNLDLGVGSFKANLPRGWRRFFTVKEDKTINVCASFSAMEAFMKARK